MGDTTETKKRRRKGPGRPPALEDPDTAKKLAGVVTLLRAGAHRLPACRKMKVPYSTFRDVLRRGKRRGAAFQLDRDFRHTVIEAESEAELRVAQVAYKAAAKDPRYALAFLAIRWRKRWNPRQRVELTGKDGDPLQVETPDREPPPDLSKLSLDDLRTYKTLVAKMAGAPSKGGARTS